MNQFSTTFPRSKSCPTRLKNAPIVSSYQVEIPSLISVNFLVIQGIIPSRFSIASLPLASYCALLPNKTLYTEPKTPSLRPPSESSPPKKNVLISRFIIAIEFLKSATLNPVISSAKYHDNPSFSILLATSVVGLSNTQPITSNPTLPKKFLVLVKNPGISLPSISL